MDQGIEAASVGFWLALAVTAIAILVLRRHAERWGLVDRPAERKLHWEATPAVGGLALAIGSAAALPAAIAYLDLQALKASEIIAGGALVAATALIVGLGLADDRWGLGSGIKFLVQAGVAVLVILATGSSLESFGTWPTGAVMATGVLAVPISVVAIVGFMNAFNMIDGVDGLAGGVAVVMLICLGLAAWLADASWVMLSALTLSGGCVGFLLFNLRTPWRSRASVFLGDAGSLFLGLVIVWIALEVSQGPGAAVSPVAIAWVLALPVIDTLNLMSRRLLRGRNPFHADRNHFHHLLGRAGFSVGQSAMIVIGLTLVMGAVGIGGALIGVPDLVLGLGLILVAGLHYVFVRYAWRSTKAMRRLRAWLARSDADRLPPADRLAIVGMYGLALAVPWGSGTLVALGAGVLAIASAVQWRALVSALRGLPITRVSGIMAIWLTLAVLLRPTPVFAIWLPMMVMAGAFALPLGWWLARFRYHALPLFALALVGMVGAWVLAADWPMLEAGYIRSVDHWGGIQAGGFTLVLMLMVMVGAAAYGLVHYARRWRGRVSLASALIGIPLMVTLLLGLSLQSAVATAVIGLVAMIAAASAQTGQRALRYSVTAGAVLTVLVGALLAHVLKPTEMSLQDQYWGPVQASFLYLGGAADQAQASYPGVATRFADWQSTAAAARQRPLAGYGHPGPPNAPAVIPAQRSAVAALVLTGGLPALVLAGALLVTWLRAIGQGARRRSWSSLQVVVAHGLLWTMLATLALAPTVDQPLNGMIITVVWALGVVASLDNRQRADSDGPLGRLESDSKDDSPVLLRVVGRS